LGDRSPRDISERVWGLTFEQLLEPIDSGNQINILVVRGRDSSPKMDWAWDKKLLFYTLD